MMKCKTNKPKMKAQMSFLLNNTGHRCFFSERVLYLRVGWLGCLLLVQRWIGLEGRSRRRELEH